MTGIITLIPKSSEGLCNQRFGVELRPEATPQKFARERLGPGSTIHQRKGWGEEGAEGSPFSMAPSCPTQEKKGRSNHLHLGPKDRSAGPYDTGSKSPQQGKRWLHFIVRETEAPGVEG